MMNSKPIAINQLYTNLLRFLDIDDLIAIHTISKTINLTKAADLLNVSPASLSARISNVEKRLDMSLFNRSHKGIELNNSGLTLLPLIDRVLSAQEEFLAAVNSLNQIADGGYLSISCPQDFGEIYLTPIIQLFLQENPTVQIDIEHNNSSHIANQTSFDILIRGYRKFINQPLQEKNVHAQLIKIRPMVLCATPQYLKAAPTIHEPTDLKKHVYIDFNPKMRIGTHQSPAILNFESKEGLLETIELKAQHHVNNRKAAQSYVLSHIGIAELPIDKVHKHIENGSIVAILPNFQVPPLCIYLLQQSKMKTALQQRFNSFIQEQMNLTQ